MTLQQMTYIVAVNKTGQFLKASELCGVTQPTLSTMIQKLEEELGVKLFDRTKQPIEATTIGKRIIAQAEVALREMKKIGEMVDLETNSLAGSLRLAIIPTIAPYLVPDLIQLFRENYPQIELTILEMTTANTLKALSLGSIDVAIAATPLSNSELLEIPLYYEPFMAYFSANHPDKEHPVNGSAMSAPDLWVLQEGHCLREQTFNFCENRELYNHAYEAGSIDTLIRIVDKNGGYSVIPELHIPFLTVNQQQNVRSITSPPAVREVSLVIHKDYLRERILNAIADSIKQIIPPHMLDNRLKQFRIKLG